MCLQLHIRAGVIWFHRTADEYVVGLWARGSRIAMPETMQLEKPVASDVHHELLARILATEHFSRAPRLQRFLTYVTDCYLQGHPDEITEQQIGVHVFDKPAGYNPGDDNVVRSYARTLRKRLEEYFAKEGSAEPLIIEIPRGGYVPVFVQRPVGRDNTPAHELLHQSEAGESPTREAERKPFQPVTSVKQRDSWHLRLWIPTLLIICLISCIVSFRIGRQVASPSSSPAVHAFWQRFSGDRSTMIVPSDTGLTLILGLTKGSVSVPEYVTGAYVSREADGRLLPEGWANTNVHRYTDLIDVKVVSSLSHLPELPVEKTTIRYARDLRADDLKEGNAVLIGGANANPWVQLFDQKLNYALEFAPQERTFLVKNRRPNAGEPSSYPYGPANWSQVSYGLVALRPSLNGKGYVLVIEGVAAAGLQGAAEYLLDEGTMGALLPQITDATGRLKPFEMLLRTNNVGANATKTEVLGMRLN